MEAEVAAGLNLKKYMNREHYISTYPFQATRPLSVLFSIEIKVPLSAAIEITRGGRRFGLKKRTLDGRSGEQKKSPAGAGLVQQPLAERLKGGY